jgi:AraC-like DNA-binding protein
MMASADLPLASHCQFASNDFEAMHHRLSNVLKPHRLRRLSDVPVSGIICRANLIRISINLMRIGPAVDVWPGALDHFYLVQIPIHGAVQISLGGERILCAGTTAAVISPGEALRLRWSDNCAQLILQIPRETIEGRLAERFGFRRQSPLKFQAAFDLASPVGRDWLALLNLTVRSVDESGMFSRDPLCADLEDLLLSGLLAAQPHNYAGELRDGGSAPVPYYVLRAEREMRERMATQLEVASLADLAGVSERTLHDGFRRFRATTPMARLAALRLAAARRRLLDAEPGMTVSSVASEVGFFQFGRFAGAYRNAFGELPSATLRAARRRNS